MSERAHRSIHLSLSLLVAAATLAAGATLAGAAAAAPLASGGASVRVLDVGRVRLHVPSTWVVDVATKICSKSGACRRPCAPGYDKRVYLSTFAPVLNCPLNFHRNAVWVVLKSSTGASSRKTSTYDGQSVILTIPGRGVALFGFGKRGVRAVDQMEPSTLSRVLTARLPTAIPAAWHRISDGVVSVAVPPVWPVRTLQGNVVNPGVCGQAYFPRPAAFVGAGSAVAYCTDFSISTLADAMVGPGNGVWLVGALQAGQRLHLRALFAPPGTTAQVLRIHGLAITITYPRAPNGADAALVTVQSAGRAHYLVLGLGLQPTIAESILSSLRAG